MTKKEKAKKLHEKLKIARLKRGKTIVTFRMLCWKIDDRGFAMRSEKAMRKNLNIELARLKKKIQVIKNKLSTIPNKVRK